MQQLDGRINNQILGVKGLTVRPLRSPTCVKGGKFWHSLDPITVLCVLFLSQTPWSLS